MPTNQTSDAQPREKAGATVVLWLLVGLVVLFGGLYVAAHYVAGDKVPRNTTVAGVRIGGHPQAEAAERLRAELQPGDAVLVKGSLGVGLAVVAENLPS